MRQVKSESAFVEFLPKSAEEAAALERAAAAADAASNPALQSDSYIDDYGEVGDALPTDSIVADDDM